RRDRPLRRRFSQLNAWPCSTCVAARARSYVKQDDRAPRTSLRLSQCQFLLGETAKGDHQRPRCNFSAGWSSLIRQRLAAIEEKRRAPDRACHSCAGSSPVKEL